MFPRKKRSHCSVGRLPPRTAVSRQGPRSEALPPPPHSCQPAIASSSYPPLSPLSPPPKAPSLTATALTQPPADMSRLTGEGGGRGSSGIPPPKTESAVQARKSFYCSSLSLPFFFHPPLPRADSPSSPREQASCAARATVA